MVLIGDDIYQTEKIGKQLAEHYGCKFITPVKDIQKILADKVLSQKSAKRNQLLQQAVNKAQENKYAKKTESYNKKLQDYDMAMADGNPDGLEHPGDPPQLTEIKIDPESKSVQKILDELMMKEDFSQIKLEPSEIISTLPDLDPINDSYILHNFPRNVAEFDACTKHGIEPDDFLFIKDTSSNFAFTSTKFFREVLSAEDQESFRTSFNKRNPTLQPLVAPLCLPADANEFENSRRRCQENLNNWTSLSSKLNARNQDRKSNSRTFFSPHELVVTDVDETNENVIRRLTKEIKSRIENRFIAEPQEYTGADAEEEEDDANQIVDIIEKEDNIQWLADVDANDPEVLKKFVRNYGIANKYDIVDAANNNVIFPGIPDHGLKYKSKVYFFRNEDNAAAFLKNPLDFIPASTENLPVPPPRICIVGPPSSGKSYLAKTIAKRYNLFHFDLKIRLQELIISKLRRKMGPDYAEEREFERVSMFDIDRICKELVQADTDFRDLMTNLNETSKQLYEAGENGITTDLTDAVKEMINENDLEDRPELPEAPELDEFAEGIVEALENARPLDGFHLKPIISPLWEEEPYKSRGFIIEGFPRHHSDIQFLEENSLWPDCCIVLNSEVNSAITRKLDDRMDFYKRKNTHLINLREAMVKKRQELRTEMIENRKKSLHEKNKQLEEKKAEREKRLEAKRQQLDEAGEDPDTAELTEEEDDHDDDNVIVDVDMIISREFNDYFSEEQGDDYTQIGFEELEDEADAVDRIKSEITENYENLESMFQTVQEAFDEFSLPKHVVETANRRKEVVKQQVMKVLTPTMYPLRNNVYENVNYLDIKTAESLIKSGFAKTSPYGYFDPVSIENGDIASWHSSCELEKKVPVLKDTEIFWFDSEENKKKFSADPLKYWACILNCYEKNCKSIISSYRQIVASSRFVISLNRCMLAVLSQHRRIVASSYHSKVELLYRSIVKSSYRSIVVSTYRCIVEL